MDNYLYKCQYCGKEFRPNRRNKQKFCSNSCRVGAFNLKKEKGLGLPVNEVEKKAPLKVEKMSFAGVGNAAVGTLAVNAITSLFTKEEDKVATKGDMKDLLANLKQRYQPVKNLANRPDGTKPFFDSHTQTIVYLTKSF
ncbi:hypothetical protein [Flavobacterium ovatum]|uniref:hypothetical protein n=1 Tax=Flavobacterium ovatum TaxID=1928857 RepID=UPI00344C03E3